MSSELSFVFISADSEMSEIETVVTSYHVREFLQLGQGQVLQEDTNTNLSHALFTILSSKTTTMVSATEGADAGGRTRYLGRRTREEEQHLIALLCWCANCGCHRDEPLFSRIGPKSKRRRYLTGKDLVGPLKEGTQALGLDPARYSGKSMRITYASVALAANVPLDERNAIGWAPGSHMAATVYSRAAQTRNTAAVLSPEKVGDIERAIRMGSTLVSQRSKKESSPHGESSD